MGKTILLTGATDGIGLETAKILAGEGHTLLLHGRNATKLENTKKLLETINPAVSIQTFVADFSVLADVRAMADKILALGIHLDVLINNAGVFVVRDEEKLTADGLDIRFAVNTIAPYILAKKLLPLMDGTSRLVNMSSAAQAPLDFNVLMNRGTLDHSSAYAQSKLAIIMWGLEVAKDYPNGPLVVAVNPKSFLGSKMVKAAYGRKGYDLKFGADILHRAALSQEFAQANGKYYDNDNCRFAPPHPYANVAENREKLVDFMNRFL